MVARVLTYLIIGALLIAAVAVSAPQYLSYLWFVLGALFIGLSGYLAFYYAKRTYMILKDTNDE